MRALLPAVLLVLLPPACGPGSTAPAKCTPGAPIMSTGAAVIDEGEPATLPLVAPWSCAGVEGLSVEVAVLDGLNDPVPAQGSLAMGTSQLTANVSFTPTRPGSHHITARFQPNLGTVTADAFVVSPPRRDAGAELLLAVALEPCANIHLTPGGLAVCLADTTTTVYVDQTRVQSLALGSSPVMAGGVIWTLNGNRWVEGTQADGGRGFRREPDAGPLAGISRLMGPTPEDVVVVDSQRVLRRLRFTDGGLELDPLGKAPGATSPTTPTTGWWRDGDTIIAPESGDAGCSVLDGGVRFCRAPPSPSALEPAGIWYVFNTSARDSISLVRPEGVAEVVLPSGISTRPARRGWNSGLVFGLGSPAVDYVATWRDGIVIQRAGAPVHSADAEWLFLENPLRAVRR